VTFVCADGGYSTRFPLSMGHLLVLVRFVVLEGTECRQLPFVEDANDPDALRFRAVEYDVARVVNAKETRADVVACATNPAALGEVLAERLEFAQVLVGLSLIPAMYRVGAYLAEVRPPGRRCTEGRH
jgi:hypothetical protein